MTGSTEEIADVPQQAWWHRWFVAPLKSQLTQGISVDRLAWSISLGVVLGVFPILGSTTAVCLLAAWGLHLNHVAMQVSKEAVYPVHLLMIPVFIHLGERMAGVPLTSFSIPELIGKFKTDPLLFVKNFGMAAWYAVCAWLLFAPVALVLIKWAAVPILKRLAESLKKRKAVAP